MSQQPAWLIDSSIYVFKAWYTWTERFDIYGNPVHAVHGFIDFAYRLLSTERPELVAFAFDESLKTSHRKEIYPQYKANRPQAPEDLRRQFQYCRKFLRAFGIFEDASFHYEADDLIGSWAKSLRNVNIPVNIITADKDLAQLIHENDHWWEYERGQKLDTKALTKKFRAKPRQIADQLAIAGDKSDNIPGVPGIGMSTAGKLLRKFDTLENLFASTAEISSMQIRGAARIQQLIEEYKETITLSRRLTGIECDIATVDSNDLKRSSFFDKKDFKLFCHEISLPDEIIKKWLALNQNF